MDYFNDFLSRVLNVISEFLFIFNRTLFKIGDSEVSIGTIVIFFASFYLLVVVSKNVRLLLLNKILARSKLKKSFRESIANGVRITMMLIGTIIIIQAVGIDLSALSLLAGALGVGIGFGFQKVTDNLISGLTILVEEPIKVGDRVEVGEVSGDIVNISLRATTIVTNDNISIIVPNSEFISSQVINWSHNNRIVRFRLPVGVSYEEDPEIIKKLLLEVADENPNVQKEPKPKVFFEKFGDSSLDFKLGIWTSSHTDKPEFIRSEINYAIFQKFRENNIKIPFPQRDVHIKSKSE
ncbi:MAG: mechanosensitive ion channel family protein [Cytophagales bacterium]|nr:mechanosensitive ion channel protein MscS [Flammeovirgaceae bacterium]PDH43862.1 MAG: mechanosensitive ion channel protein MscS [Rhodothermaeota bacterium MED-G18]|tara:strand:+ start:298 stop:1182 length:885 start_codon:yes stop_codon:yes gene_type:complete